MSAVGDLESAIVARLAAALTLPGQEHPKVEVRAWPDKPSSYRMNHPHGAALVIFRGSQFTHGDTGGQLVSYDDVFELGLISRTLREPNAPGDTLGVGIYDLLEICRNALLGWTPAGASSAVRLVSVDFDAYSEGTWGYSLRVAVPQTTVADRHGAIGPWTDESVTPPLTSRQFEYESTN